MGSELEMLKYWRGEFQETWDEGTSMIKDSGLSSCLYSVSWGEWNTWRYWRDYYNGSAQPFIFWLYLWPPLQDEMLAGSQQTYYSNNIWQLRFRCQPARSSSKASETTHWLLLMPCSHLVAAAMYMVWKVPHCQYSSVFISWLHLTGDLYPRLVRKMIFPEAV